jgi:hypothetical protein
VFLFVIYIASELKPIPKMAVFYGSRKLQPLTVLTVHLEDNNNDNNMRILISRHSSQYSPEVSFITLQSWSGHCSQKLLILIEYKHLRNQ